LDSSSSLAAVQPAAAPPRESKEHTEAQRKVRERLQEMLKKESFDKAGATQVSVCVISSVISLVRACVCLSVL
jgi:hypothetical protein